ncbi:YbaB/EbfC family nucleoid-associated protein, partial [Kibdelosporangium lantanae]
IGQVREQVAERGRKRFSGSSPDRSVKVVVDGNRNLVRLEIAPGAHRTAHPERLATTIMDTVNRARDAVFTKYVDEFVAGGRK